MNFLMVSICKVVTVFGYLSAEGKRGERRVYLRVGIFACWFNQKLDIGIRELCVLASVFLK